MKHKRIEACRVIDLLRREYPGRWTYSFPYWEHESGWYVYRCAALAPRFDGDDDSFDSHLRRSDTGERIWMAELRQLLGTP